MATTVDCPLVLMKKERGRAHSCVLSDKYSIARRITRTSQGQERIQRPICFLKDLEIESTQALFPGRPPYRRAMHRVNVTCLPLMYSCSGAGLAESGSEE